MKDIRLYSQSALAEAFTAGALFSEGNPDLWREVFSAGESRGASFFDNASNAPNWIQYMAKEKKMSGQKFKDWLRANEKRLGIFMDKERFLTAATEAEIMQRVGQKLITLSAIEDVVSLVFDIPINTLRYANTRKMVVVIPRQNMAYLSYFHAHATLSEIGVKCGGRDHATILHGVKQVAKLASIPGKDRVALKNLYRELVSQGYNIHHYVQADDSPSRKGIFRTLVQPVNLEL